MNSSVTALSETSVMSSSCFEIRVSSRSNGPSKTPSETRNPAALAVVQRRLARGVVRRRRHGRPAPRQPHGRPGRPACSGANSVIGIAGDRGIRELHRAADHRLEHLVAEGLDDALEHLARVQRARVVHRREHAVELDRRVQPVAHLVDRLDQQRDAAQGEELALERDEHAVARGQRVDGEQAERGLAVDEDDVVVGARPCAARARGSARGRPR